MARIIKEFKKEVKPCELDLSEIEGFYASQPSALNVARKNKFLLVLDLPQCFNPLKDTGVGRACSYFNTQKLIMNVFGTVVPELEMEALEVKGWGQSPKVSSLARPSFKPVNIQFTVDTGYENYFVVYKWMDLMNNTLEGGFDANNEINRKGHLADYSTTFSLYAVGEYNKPTVRWNYYGSFPTSLGNIQFSKRDPDELETDFTFEYSFIKMELL